MLTVESFWSDFSKHHQSPEQLDTPSNQEYLLAYSGGCDSHVLLHLLSEFKRLKLISNVKAVHVNHQLHDDSNRWAAHCVQQCENYSIPCDVINVNVDKNSGLGLEATARTARYEALKMLVNKGQYLLTAQHSDDQVETFLLQSLRGGGVKGLSSMPIIKPFSKGFLYRPLLHVSQLNVSEYAATNKLNWVDDPSNEDTEFDRNFLRKNIIPVLKQRWPSLNKTFHRITQHQAEAANLIDELAVIDLALVQADEKLISIEKLNTLSINRQKNVLRFWIENQNKLTMPDSTHLMRILNEVVVAAEDSQPSVAWSDTVIRRFQGKLYAEKYTNLPLLKTVKHWNPEQVYDLYATENNISHAEQLKTSETIGKGLSVTKLLNKNVSIRFRDGGEVCCPQGRGPHQHKLKKLLQEWEVPPWQRDSIPLVYVDDILAQVVGYCLCEPFAACSDEPAYQIVLS